MCSHKRLGSYQKRPKKQLSLALFLTFSIFQASCTCSSSAYVPAVSWTERLSSFFFTSVPDSMLMSLLTIRYIGVPEIQTVKPTQLTGSGSRFHVHVS